MHDVLGSRRDFVSNRPVSYCVLVRSWSIHAERFTQNRIKVSSPLAVLIRIPSVKGISVSAPANGGRETSLRFQKYG
jgi:hypothetical protein